MDFHSDRTTVRANQSIVDIVADEPDLPELAQLTRVVRGGMKRSVLACQTTPTLAASVANEAAALPPEGE